MNDLSCDVTIEYRASQLTLYSTDELRCLDRNVLHSLLSSESLCLSSEDWLLSQLIELGDDYFEFLHYVEVILLSKEGISHFVGKMRFSDLTSDI
jgi:hypothetical protein